MFVGVALLAVLALGVTAASVDTSIQTLDPNPEPETDIEPDEKLCGQDPESEAVRNCGGAGNRTDGGTGGGGDLNRSGTTEREPRQSAGPALWQVVAGVSLLVVGGIIVLYGLTRGDGNTLDVLNTETAHPGTGQTGQNLPVGDVPATNDVYRVWIALTDEIQPESDAVSPAALTTRAIEQGFDEAPVRAICREFCAIRYGEGEPTESREKRVRDLAAKLGLVEGEE